MNKASSTSTLKAPGPKDTQRHQLRQRSPQGQRGRSRRTPAPPPPPTALESIRASRLFIPSLVAFAAVVLALLYSALRISSHTADHYPPAYPRANPVIARAKKPRVGRAGAPEPRTTSSSSAPPNAHTVKVGEREVDEAIRSALEQTWHLSGPDRAEDGDGDGPDTARRHPPAVTDESAVDSGDGPVKRSLSDLYQELDELGISAEDLNQVLQNAIGGNL